MILEEALQKRLKDLAEEAYPKECCGILLGKGEGKGNGRRITEVMPLPNDAGAKDTETHFQINPLLVYEAEQIAAEQGLSVLGFYHSHPDHEAVLSKEDSYYQIPGLTYLILSVFDGRCKEIRSYEK